MPEPRAAFSLSEMADLKRQRGVAPPQAPPAGAAEAAWVPTPDLSGTPRQEPRCDGAVRSLRRRRWQCVVGGVRRQGLVLLLTLVAVVGAVWVVDAFLRQPVWETRATCSLERPAPWTVLNTGLPEGVGPLKDPPHPRRLLLAEATQNHLRDALRQQAQTGAAAGTDSGDPEATVLARRLAAMAQPGQAGAQALAAYRGHLTTHVRGERSFEMELRGPYPRVQEAVLAGLASAVDRTAREWELDGLRALQSELALAARQNRSALARLTERRQRLQGRLAARSATRARSRKQGAAQSRELTERRAEEELELLDLRSRVEYLQERLGWDALKERFRIEGLADLPEVFVEGNPLRERWRELAAREAELLTRYNDAHPQLRALRRKIAALRQQLLIQNHVTLRGEVPPLPRLHEEEQLREFLRLSEAMAIAQRRADLWRERNAAAPAAGAASAVSPESQALTEAIAAVAVQEEECRERDVALDAWQGRLERLCTAGEEVHLVQMQVQPASRKRSPNLPLDLSIAAGLGVVGGAVLAWFLEVRDPRLRSSADVHLHLQAPVLTALPAVAANSRIDQAGAGAVLQEGYRRLCHSIRYHRGLTEGRGLLITSPDRRLETGEVAANMGIAWAEERNQVLLVNADPADATLLARLGLLPEEDVPGLDRYLEAGGDVRTVLCESAVAGLAVVPAGTDLRRVLRSRCAAPALRTFFSQAAAQFDLVLVHGPPVLGDIGLRPFVPLAPAAVLVLTATQTDVTVARQSLRDLDEAGMQSMGVVLNRTRESCRPRRRGARARVAHVDRRGVPLFTNYLEHGRC